MTNEQYNRFREIAEGKHRRPVYLAIQAQIQPVVEAFRTGGHRAAIQAANREIMNEALVPVIRDIYVQGGVYMAKKQYRELQQLDTKFIKEWGKLILEFFNKYILSKAVLPITQTTRDLILKVLADSVASGLGVNQTIIALRMLETTRQRANTIVRTEMGSAFGYGQMLSGEEFDYEVKKKWRAINDNRTRRTHKHGTGVDGEVREWRERFSNGLLFPGDKAGPPGEVINCRCRLVIVPKRDASGRLIPKNRPNRSVSVGLLAGVQGLQMFAQSLLLSEAIENLINTE